MRIRFPSVLLVGCASLTACGSGGDPSLGSEVAGVLVVASNGNNGGSNSNTAFIAAAALGEDGFFVSTADGCGGGCQGTGQAEYALTFAPAQLLSISLTPFTGGVSGNSSGVEMGVEAGTLYWAMPGQIAIPMNGSSPGIALWATDAGGASASQAPVWASFPLFDPAAIQTGTQYNGYEIVGMVALSGTVYVSVALISNSNGESVPGSPDSPTWSQGAGGGGGTAVASHLPSQGLIFAVSCPNPPCNTQVAPPAVSTTFDPAVALHTLVAFGSSLCWLDGSDEVLCVPSGWGNGTPPTPTVLAAPSLPSGWSLVALASGGKSLVWAAAPDVAPGIAGCAVWTNGPGATPAQIYDGSQASFFCRGLATDGQYAYFTTNEVTGYSQGPSCTNCTNGYTVSGIVGNGVGRAPIGGGAAQMLPLQSQNWYGPRRVFVDATSVYAVDPSYVVRVPAAAFTP